jgi:hypothetical protein
MLEHFYDWHRDMGLEPNDETSPKHRKIIGEYAPTAREIISLGLFFYGFDSQGASLENFGKALQDVDTSFSMQHHKQNLVLFAGAELVSVVQRALEGQLADLAALCLVCGSVQGARRAVPVPEMPEIAARYIESRTTNRAVVSAGQDGKEPEPRLIKLEREMEIVSEETNMLWWLVSDYSRDCREPWKKIGVLATPIVAGKELADLTRVIPGPVAAAAFLDRIIRLPDSPKAGKPVGLIEAIDKTPRPWKEKLELVGDTEMHDLMPISKAIKLSLSVSDGDDWSAVFQNGTKLQADSKLAANALAYQMFLERLLDRLSAEVVR